MVGGRRASAEACLARFGVSRIRASMVVAASFSVFDPDISSCRPPGSVRECLEDGKGARPRTRPLSPPGWAGSTLPGATGNHPKGRILGPHRRVASLLRTAAPLLGRDNPRRSRDTARPPPGSGGSRCISVHRNPPPTERAAHLGQGEGSDRRYPRRRTSASSRAL